MEIMIEPWAEIRRDIWFPHSSGHSSQLRRCLADGLRNSTSSSRAAIIFSDVVAMNSSKGVEGGGITLVRPYAIVSQAKQVGN